MELWLSGHQTPLPFCDLLEGISRPLGQGNALNLDGGVLGQGLDGDAAAGGLVDHPLFVLLVHLGKVGHVGQEDVDLDNLLHRGAGLLEHGFEVLEAQRRLLGNGALGQGALGVEVNLTRAVDCGRGLDRVGLYISSWWGK
jgi:hypothetical protein